MVDEARIKNPFLASWALLLLALVLSVAGTVLSFLHLIPGYVLLLGCPVVWALVFGGSLHGNRVARRIREEADRCSEPSSEPS